MNTVILVLPGLGATSAMYVAEPWKTLPAARFADWPVKKVPRSMEELAVEIVRREGVREGDMVIGSSLGGMAGCEIARLVRLRLLVLIGSAVGPGEINRFLRMMHPVARVAPWRLLCRLAGFLSRPEARMFSVSDPAFLRCLPRAIFQWEGLRADVPVFRIHGRRDRLIPLPDQVDLTLNCGHIPAMARPRECVEAIRKLW